MLGESLRTRADERASGQDDPFDEREAAEGEAT
jgi:hypothetical protein